jgi:hypothetical protein
VLPPRVTDTAPRVKPIPLPISTPAYHSDSKATSPPLRRSPRFSAVHPMLHHGQFAQAIHHLPPPSGPMFNPSTGRKETIDSLLRGTDKDV